MSNERNRLELMARIGDAIGVGAGSVADAYSKFQWDKLNRSRQLADTESSRDWEAELLERQQEEDRNVAATGFGYDFSLAEQRDIASLDRLKKQHKWNVDEKIRQEKLADEKMLASTAGVAAQKSPEPVVMPGQEGQHIAMLNQDLLALEDAILHLQGSISLTSSQRKTRTLLTVI
jgi:hypothetical protein